MPGTSFSPLIRHNSDITTLKYQFIKTWAERSYSNTATTMWSTSLCYWPQVRLFCTTVVELEEGFAVWRIRWTKTELLSTNDLAWQYDLVTTAPCHQLETLPFRGNN